MKNCLIISDTHFPYAHKDTFSFLEAVSDQYGIEVVKHSGDLADNHTASYHEIEYGTLSAQEEYRKAKRDAQRLSELFPEMNVVLGNHCKLSYRKAKTANIPEEHLKSYNDVYGVNWNWMDKDYFQVSGADDMCLLTHAMSSSTLNNAKTHSHSSIQGHHHGCYGIEYFADTETLRFSMTVGCLVDPHSPAFNYARGATTKRPILGVGLIIENAPILQPMRLKKSGRWNNKL